MEDKKKVYPIYDSEQLLVEQKKDGMGNQGVNKSALDVANEDFQKADPIKALQFKKQMQIVAHDGEPYQMCEDLNDLNQYGVGIRLFFEFIKAACICFFLMGLTTIPSLYSNFEGGGLDASQSGLLVQSTVANQPSYTVLVASDTATQVEIDYINAQNEKNLNEHIDIMNERQNWIFIPDLVTCFLFGFFLIYWKWKSSKIIKESKQTAKPNAFTVQLKNIPPELRSEEKIKEHFAKFDCKIVEVSFVKNYFGTLFLYKSLADLDKKIVIEEKRLQQKGQRASDNLEKMQNQMLELQEKCRKQVKEKAGDIKGNDDYPTLRAFVVFSDIETKNRVIDMYKKANPICGEKKHFLMIDGMMPATNVGTGESIARGCCVILSILLIMLITFAVIFVANVLRKSPTTYICPTTDYTLQDVQLAQDQTQSSYNSTADAQTTECFCKKQSLDTLTNDADVNSVCLEFYLNYLYQTLFQIGIALVVSITNIVFKIVLKSLATFRRYSNVTSETTGITFNLFLAMFINTAILTALLSADIYGFVPAIQITQPVPPLKALQEDNTSSFQTDFHRDWYVAIGNKIITALLIQTVSPHLILILTLPLTRCLRKMKYNKALIQMDMNEYVIGPSFEVTQFYAVAMTIIFSCFFYSSGMPILHWVACISLFIQFWCYKYLLFRFNRRPPQYDASIDETIREALPYALIFHLSIATYMHSNDIIFPSSGNALSGYVDTSTASQVQVGSGSASADVQNRILAEIVFFILLILVVVYLIIEKTLGNILIVLYKLIFCIQDDKEVAELKSFEEEKDAMIKTQIVSYKIFENPTYSQLISQMEKQGKGKGSQKTEAEQKIGEEVEHLSDEEIQ